MSRCRKHFGIQVSGIRSFPLPTCQTAVSEQKRKQERFAVILFMVARG